MSDRKIDETRRKVLVAATNIAAGTAAAATAAPFIASMAPSERARAASAPVDVEFSGLGGGELLTAEWRSRPVWILRRTGSMLRALEGPHHLARLADPQSATASQQPDYARNRYRSIRPEVLVVVPVCTHLGCIPTYRPDVAPADLGPEWRGGFFCPCHGSRFDLAGRVYRNVPAPTNLVIPPHFYLSNTKVKVGRNPGSATA